MRYAQTIFDNAVTVWQNPYTKSESTGAAAATASTSSTVTVTESGPGNPNTVTNSLNSTTN